MAEIKITPVGEMLDEAWRLLARLEQAEPYPGLETMKRETKYRIERLERRMREQSIIEQQIERVGDA